MNACIMNCKSCSTKHELKGYINWSSTRYIRCHRAAKLPPRFGFIPLSSTILARSILLVYINLSIGLIWLNIVLEQQMMRQRAKPFHGLHQFCRASTAPRAGPASLHFLALLSISFECNLKSTFGSSGIFNMTEDEKLILVKSK